MDMVVADFCRHLQEECAGKLTRAVPVTTDTAGQGGSHGQWGPHGNVRFLLGSGVHTGAGSHQALRLVHRAGGCVTPGRGAPTGPGGLVDTTQGAP